MASSPRTNYTIEDYADDYSADFTDRSLVDKAFADSLKNRDIVSVTATSKTIALGDAATKQVCSNVSTQTITIPTNASVAFEIGIEIDFIRKGAGGVTIKGDTGVTLNGVSGGSVSILTQFQGATVFKEAADNWIISGNF